MNNISIKPLGDQALCITFGREITMEVSKRIREVSKQLSNMEIPGVIELLPTYCTLMVSYQPTVISYRQLTAQIEKKLEAIQTVALTETARRIYIPVCYGGEYGPDLPFVAQHAGITEKEVIERHSGRDYPIFMLGFLPGFPYLGAMDPSLYMPRLSAPRLKIEAGSVGIGGTQTGIYPSASPGGWRLIGRTPVKLFDPKRTPSIPYSVGELIRFVPISPKEYEEIEKQGDGYCLKVDEGVSV